MNHGGNGQPVLASTAAPVARRGRDLARLALLGVALAVLWALAFSITVRDWGAYRPAGLASQAPPPALVLDLPPLTLREAQELVNRTADQAEQAHEPH